MKCIAKAKHMHAAIFELVHQRKLCNEEKRKKTKQQQQADDDPCKCETRSRTKALAQ